MNFQQLNELRPKDASAAAHETALLTLRALRGRTEAAIDTLTQERGQALLHAGADGVREAEAKIADARLDIEQIDALMVAIDRDLPETRATEKAQAWKQRHAHLAAMVAEQDRFALEEYPELAAGIVAGLKRLEAFRRSVTHFEAEWNAESADVKAKIALDPVSVGFTVQPGLGVLGFTGAVRLPALRRPGADTPAHDPDVHAWNGVR